MAWTPLVGFTGIKSLWASPDAFPITPSDDNDLEPFVRAIRAGGAGDIHVITGNGNERTLKIAENETRYIAIRKVFATGTTATDLEGMA